MIEELLNKEVNIDMELIDTHKCRFMGDVNTYNVTLKDKDFRYVKSILNKPYGGACILPIDKNGNVFLEIQYRFPIRQPILELPAGRNEDNESFLECARRELKEETGCISDKIIPQIELYAQPEFTDEIIGSFVALDCEKVEEQHLDSDESVTVIEVPFELAVDLVKRNVIIDERTITAIGMAKCIQGVSFEESTIDREAYATNMAKRIHDEGMLLEEKDIDIDYTEVCEFGVVQDHIVRVPGDKNSRRECFYLKAEDIVLPISNNGKLGFFVRYMPSIGKNMVQLPCKLEFDKDTNFEEFGEMVTTVGYANDRQYMYLVKDIEETDSFVWLSREETLEYIKNGVITDGRVLGIVLKYLS